MSIIAPFKIDGFIVHPSLNKIQHHSKWYSVEPTVMSVLLLLADAKGGVVERAQILDSVWPDVFVSESNVYKSISSLRKVFASEKNGQAYIETIPKVGYRLIPRAEPVPNTVGNAVSDALATPVEARSVDLIQRVKLRHVMPSQTILSHRDQGRKAKLGYFLSGIVSVLFVGAIFLNPRIERIEVYEYVKEDGTTDSTIVHSVEPLTLANMLNQRD